MTSNDELVVQLNTASLRTGHGWSSMSRPVGITPTSAQPFLSGTRGNTGYVTNLPTDTMSGQAVISAYHDLWEVEASFRVTKSDLRAQPVFRHQREAIEAHLTVVFAALAISRYLQAATGVSMKKIVRTLRTNCTAVIEVNGQQRALEPEITEQAQELLEQNQGSLSPAGEVRSWSPRRVVSAALSAL